MSTPRRTRRRKVAQVQADSTANIETNFCKAKVLNQAEESKLVVNRDRYSKMFFDLYKKSRKTYQSSWIETNQRGIEWLIECLSRPPLKLSFGRPEVTSLDCATPFDKHNISVFLIQERITSLDFYAMHKTS
ncbi:hypothetical protein RRG08_010458 [Elysia crispata]|uniref:Uncharacterized protein n=1 Tax=Elysia crispata TaxID=231223 RepID=A0AAE1E1N9_9GAST|nr:hypothetical protein RRG08_010458 [Elysia crispata]